MSDALALIVEKDERAYALFSVATEERLRYVAGRLVMDGFSVQPISEAEFLQFPDYGRDEIRENVSVRIKDIQPRLAP